MSVSLYTATVPVFKQMLLALSDVLKKGKEHAEKQHSDPAVLLQSKFCEAGYLLELAVRR